MLVEIHMQKLNSAGALDEQFLMDTFDAIAFGSMNRALTACGAIVATATTDAKTVATCAYLSNGVFKSKGATDNFWVFTTAHTIPANPLSAQEQVYGLCIKASDGSAVITLGGIATGAGKAPLPERPAAGIVQVAQVRVSVAAGATPATDFVGGTTDVATAGGFTVTYSDIGALAPLFGAAQ
jgi:hypothetical protein